MVAAGDYQQGPGEYQCAGNSRDADASIAAADGEVGGRDLSEVDIVVDTMPF